MHKLCNSKGLIMQENEFVNAILSQEGGWDKIDGNIDEKQRMFMKKEQLRKAQIFYKAFNTEYGKLALEELVKMFLMGSIANPRDDMITVGIREGSARVVKFLLQQNEIAKKG